MYTRLCRLLPALLLLPVVSTFGQDKTAVTVYNNDLAVVRQVRALELNRGIGRYAFDGVAAQIDPTSVHFKAKGVSVLEQNFDYDLVGVDALTRRFLGEWIDVHTEDETIRGTLLSSNDGIVLELEDGSVRWVDRGAVESVSFPRLAEGLDTRPTLRWLLDSERQGSVDAELSYLTSGMSWEASYVATVAKDDKTLDLAGWVQIDNRSGATYEDADLKLLAGDVHRAPQEHMRGGRPMASFEAADEAKGFQQEQFFEYHLYTLPRAVTLKDRQVKQIGLFESASTPVEKTYTYEAFRNADRVDVSLVFTNSEKAGLGMPLPGGKVRVMQAASDGSLQLVGEDRIDHTPRDEEIRLTVGKAFDIVCERKQTDSRSIGQAREQSYEVELRNRKEETVTITVVERFRGDWTVLEESKAGTKLDAGRYEWQVKVPADKEVIMTYKVRWNR
ncbi:DUF4139 domain-containing protein [bacterium]|nr:DUF4139 domain-containing protein [bacterium]